MINLSTVLSQGGATLPAFCAVIASGTDASVSAGSYIPFAATTFDNTSMFNTSTHVATTATGGIYIVTLQIYFTNSSSNSQLMNACLFRNGARYIPSGAVDVPIYMTVQPQNFTSGTCCVGVTGIVSASAGDTWGFKAETNTLRHYQGHSSFSMTQVR